MLLGKKHRWPNLHVGLRRCSSGTSIGWIVHPLVYLQIPSHIAESTTWFAALAHSVASEALWKNAPEKRVIDNRTCSFNPLNLLQISHVPKAPCLVPAEVLGCPPIVYQPGRSDMQCKDQESRKNSNLRKLLLQGQPDPTWSSLINARMHLFEGKIVTEVLSSLLVAKTCSPHTWAWVGGKHRLLRSLAGFCC